MKREDYIKIENSKERKIIENNKLEEKVKKKDKDKKDKEITKFEDKKKKTFRI